MSGWRPPPWSGAGSPETHAIEARPASLAPMDHGDVAEPVTTPELPGTAPGEATYCVTHDARGVHFNGDAGCRWLAMPELPANAVALAARSLTEVLFGRFQTVEQRHLTAATKALEAAWPALTGHATTTERTRIRHIIIGNPSPEVALALIADLLDGSDA